MITVVGSYLGMVRVPSLLILGDLSQVAATTSAIQISVFSVMQISENKVGLVSFLHCATNAVIYFIFKQKSK